MISDDVQQRAKHITDIVDASACELVSDEMVAIAYKKRWFNDDLKRLRRERNVAETKAKFTNDPPDWNDYRHKRNIYNRHLKQSKDEDLISIITSCEGNQKRTCMRNSGMGTNSFFGAISLFFSIFPFVHTVERARSLYVFTRVGQGTLDYFGQL